MPRLENITKDNCDEELQYMVEELLNPTEEISRTESWRQSRIRMNAVGMIVMHLHKVGAPEIASYLLDQLDQHLNEYDDEDSSNKNGFQEFGGKPATDYYKSYILTLRQLYTTNRGASSWDQIKELLGKSN